MLLPRVLLLSCHDKLTLLTRSLGSSLPSSLRSLSSEFTIDGAYTPLEVLDVSEASNAAIKGVRAGDVLISLNGLPLITEGIGYDVVVEAIGQEFNDGKEVELAFFRGSVMGGVDGFVGLMDGILSGDEELEVEQVREGRERRQAESAGRQRA